MPPSIDAAIRLVVDPDSGEYDRGFHRVIYTLGMVGATRRTCSAGGKSEGIREVAWKDGYVARFGYETLSRVPTNLPYPSSTGSRNSFLECSCEGQGP